MAIPLITITRLFSVSAEAFRASCRAFILLGDELITHGVHPPRAFLAYPELLARLIIFFW